MEFREVDGIKIYSGTTNEIRNKHIKNIAILKSKTFTSYFSKLNPSTLTAQGMLEGILFEEEKLIKELTIPDNEIQKIGCNYGEILNPNYEIPKPIQKSGRGRKPKPKTKSKRKTQGTGAYFSSQITFQIRNPENNINYKIKLFRNGKFQVPGIKDPSMCDLILPIKILKQYLEKTFNKEICIMDFSAVMRNYKCKLLNENLYVDLEELERIINKEKKQSKIKPYVNYLTEFIPDKFKLELKKYIGKTNILNIAELTYNNDRCFSLNIKFYRPMPDDRDKKTTVKLLKKGKINFDGGNSEFEIEELYYWLQLIYINNPSIIVDVEKIKNEYNKEEIEKLLLNGSEFIYE
jgi:hypothetical protein